MVMAVAKSLMLPTVSFYPKNPVIKTSMIFHLQAIR